ncbi:hypothetical protein DOY81_011716 [Sarcophaga bullata]|nr:hypothetical protein DOY81_011716 [Sarcophaga bullata]
MRSKVRFDIKSEIESEKVVLSREQKQTSIEIEQLNARVIEAETRLKTEVQRIKKKLQIQITELEMSLDVANKTNIDLQKVIKKQSLQLTELQAHYEDVQRQLQSTLDQYGVAQRRLAGLNGELEEVRSQLDSAQRAKRTVELQFEEAQTRINELHTTNINLVSIKSKLEQELSVVAADYEEVTKELRISDERYQKVQVNLEHTIEQVHEGTRTHRLNWKPTLWKKVEGWNAVCWVGKRIISKLEGRGIQTRPSLVSLQEALDTSPAKAASAQSASKRQLGPAEDRAECAETNLNMIRAKHRTFVTTSTVPGSQVYIQETTRTITE